MRAAVSAYTIKPAAALGGQYSRPARQPNKSLMTIYLRREAASGRREDFEHYLKAVPDVVPPEADQLD